MSAESAIQSRNPVWRTLLLVLGFSVIHFIAGAAAFLWSFRVSSAAFEGRPIGWVGRHLAQPLSEALALPLGPWVSLADGDTGLWVLLVLNSLICGLVLYGLWWLLKSGDR